MNIRHCCAIVILLPLASITAQEPRGGDPEVLLKAAMTRELVQGDLPGAVAEYRRIASGPSTSRSVAARALLQLAMAYEKQGHPDARPTYERVTREYADLAPTADLARARVAALGQATVSAQAPARRLLVDHRNGLYGKVTKDGRSYLRYNHETRAFELLDFATGRTRRLTSDGPPLADAAVGTEQLSNSGRRIAATVQVYRPGTEQQNPRPVDRVELRVFEVGGRGPGRAVASWPMDQLIRFTARTFAWSPRDDRIWAKVMFRDGSAQIVSADMKGATQIVKTIPWHDHSQPPSLSPDGRFITYHDSPDKGRPPDIMVLAADGSGEQRLEHPATDNKPMFLPDGSGIVFESNRRGPRDLWFVPVANGRLAGEPRLVWRDVGAFGQVERFADNGALSYYFAANDYAVYTVPLDVPNGVIGERSAVPVMPNDMNTGAAFSPDGRELLFFRARGRRVALRELATGREREIPLPSELGLYAMTDWCRGGEQAIVTGYTAGVGYAAYRVNVRSATVESLPLTNPVAAVCTGPRDVVYMRLRASDQTMSIVRRNLDTGAEEPLVSAPDPGCACVRFLARSPDGSSVGFVQRDAAGSRIVTIPVAGGTPSEALRAGAPIDGQVPLLQHFAWMPDGKRLLAVRYDEEFAGAKEQTQRPVSLWEVPLGGGAPRRLGVLPVSKIEGYFAGTFSLTVHPEARMLAFQSHEGYREQTWAIENLLQTIRAGS